MTEKEYPCEWCQGLGPFRRKRCPKCNELLCRHCIKDHECVKVQMIEIIDKINNEIREVPDSLEVVIDPAGNPIFLKEYQIEGQTIFGIIHKEDGSTIFCYEKIDKNPEDERITMISSTKHEEIDKNENK